MSVQIVLLRAPKSRACFASTLVIKSYISVSKKFFPLSSWISPCWHTEIRDISCSFKGKVCDHKWSFRTVHYVNESSRALAVFYNMSDLSRENTNRRV
jgi:hypothetical protein